MRIRLFLMTAALLLLALPAGLKAQANLPEVAGTRVVLMEERVEGDKRIPLRLTYHCGLLNEDAAMPGSMAMLAALVFESAGKRGSANWKAELIALDKVDELESQVAKLAAEPEKKGGLFGGKSNKKKLEKLRVELSDQRVGTDFLGVGESLNASYYAADSSEVSFEVGPSSISISLMLPRNKLALFFEIEGERRNFIPLRKFSARRELAADIGLYAIKTPEIDRETLIGRYLRSGGAYAPIVKSKYSFEKMATYKRQELLKLWKATMARADISIGVGLDALTDAEAKALTKLARVSKEGLAAAEESKSAWPAIKVFQKGEAKVERWTALRGDSAPSREHVRRLDAWLDEHFDDADKGLSHELQWLPKETLVCFRLAGKRLESMSADAALFALRTPVKVKLSELMAANVWNLEMKNARRSLAQLTKFRPSDGSKLARSESIGKRINGAGGIEIVWQAASKVPAENADQASRAKALEKLVSGVKDEAERKELARLVAKLKAKED